MSVTAAGHLVWNVLSASSRLAVEHIYLIEISSLSDFFVLRNRVIVLT